MCVFLKSLFSEPNQNARVPVGSHSGPSCKICNNGGFACRRAYKLNIFDCAKIQRSWSCCCAIHGINSRINPRSRWLATDDPRCSEFRGAGLAGAIARVLDWASAISRACLPAYPRRNSDCESVHSSLEKAPEIRTCPLCL